MTVKIGREYKANLARLKNYLLSIRGTIQEKDNIIEIDGGRCYYKNCIAKREKSNRAILIHQSGGGVEQYFFHSNCIEDLFLNEDIPIFN